MDKDKPQIKIPEIGEVQSSVVPQIRIPDSGGSITTEKLKEETDSKFKDVNFLLLGVVIILLVMVATLVIDSFHFNSATYKEYSQKEDVIKQMQKINQELLDQNKKNQQIIIEQQKQIWRLTGKK